MTAILTAAIDTERLTLLPLRVEHAEEMAAVLGDPALHRYIGGAPATAQELRKRYARMVAGSPLPVISWCNWVISVEEEAGRGRCLAGYVQATVTPSRDGAGLVAEIAWVVGGAWQGRGIAKEAARGLVRWLEERGVGTLIAHIHPDHLASVAVAASVGLTPTDQWQNGEVRWRRRVVS
ncbi:GNAT family N-acetyltransferase [Streptomyces sp. NBC_01429]|uniref:GNAT family N-acetyltransferase n=1 Tax=Streptomyces sp. NBC_01429 TaxID=2903862 RepID=UPI002E2D9129|nr:GNAT family N-acetyltransferase [Streptomyces sp. NBC_01429]